MFVLTVSFNRWTSKDPYMGRTAPLTSKRCILYIYSTNIGTEYFKHALYSPFFSLQNGVCFIMLTCLVPVLFTFYIQGVLKLKNNSGAKGLRNIIFVILRLEYVLDFLSRELSKSGNTQLMAVHSSKFAINHAINPQLGE